MYNPVDDRNARDTRIARTSKVVAVLCVSFAVTAMALRHAPSHEAVERGAAAESGAVAQGAPVAPYYMPSEYDETKLTESAETPATF